MGGAITAISAFILAGGKSTRMGADKAFVELNGRTLLSSALDIACAVAKDVRIVGSPEKFAKYAPVVEDIFRDCGPLGGIHAALRGSHSEFNLMLAIDMPFVTSSFLRYLTAEAAIAPEVAVVPRCGGRLQPLCAVYRPEFFHAAETALTAGQNKIGKLFEIVSTRVIEEDEMARSGFPPALFRNLNTTEELQAAGNENNFVPRKSRAKT
jgi:molybdopterin-guanine dinucleotide biosynthesis protein A